MNKFTNLTLAGVIFALALSPLAITADEASVRKSVEYLSSEELAGRLTGTSQEQAAATYIINELKSFGVKPLPGAEDYLQAFEFTAGLKDAGTTIAYKSADNQKTFGDRSDVQVLSFSETQTVTAPIVFAGYGIVTSAEAGFAYDSYGDLDVKDKIVLVFRYFPENIEQSKRITLSTRAAELRTKAQIARDRGAIGLIVINGPAYASGSELVPLTFDSAVAGSNLPAVSISSNVARELFAAGGKSWDELEILQQRLDAGDPAVKLFELKDLSVTLDARIEREKKNAYNVVGYLPANGTAPVEKEWVGVGGHYDHLGDGSFVSNSLAREAERGHAHVGADDNASGVAASIEAARLLSIQTRNRPVFFGFWSGEEIGLLGSTAFVRNGAIPIDQITSFVNLDMVGRSKDNKLAVQGFGSSTDWGTLIEKANHNVNFTLTTNSDPYSPSDSLSFYIAGVPSVHLFTGSHEDYHRPSDTADKINYPDLNRVANFTANLALELANSSARPAYAKVERPAGSRMGGSRSGFRVYTGTIPDYTAEVNGLLLTGVVDGSPADTAELKGGDLITEFGGRKIANIHEYMTVLEGVKVGEQVKIVYTREGKTYETVIIPGDRK